MTQDEIIEMARQAGFGLRYEGRGQISSAPTTTEKLEAFAKLVAAKEREACAEEAECIEAWYDGNRGIAKAIRARGEA